MFYVSEHRTTCDDGSECHKRQVLSYASGYRVKQTCSLCVDGVFVADPQQDGTVCSDNSRCTVHDVCSLGECG